MQDVKNKKKTYFVLYYVHTSGGVNALGKTKEWGYNFFVISCCLNPPVSIGASMSVCLFGGNNYTCLFSIFVFDNN